MTTRVEPLSRRERDELGGYVSRSAAAGRAVLFAVAVAAVGALAWRVQSALAGGGPWFLVPTAAFAAWLHRRAGRWTGGRELRSRIRRDLAENAARAHVVRVADAVALAEAEDEGPAFLVLAESGETLAFSGQYLARLAGRGFPWCEIEIREAACSRRFLGLRRRGGAFPPSAVSPPVDLAVRRRLGLADGPWQVVDVPFGVARRELGV